MSRRNCSRPSDAEITMSIAARFYRSLYVMLGLSCASLGYAELTFLPEITIFAGVVGVLLVVGYWTEGRWSLSIRAANALGGVIALGAVGYVAWQFFQPYGTSLIDTLPWPTSLLPYLGPLLMVLIPAKLFRPKHIGDLWSLFGIGLITVSLGCALAGDSLFGLLLFLYLLSLVWSLTLFYYYRHSLALPQQSASPAATPPAIFGRAAAWTAISTIFALTIFLLTPRSGDARWEFSLRAGSLQTGLNDERPGIDLNNSGLVTINRELVFEVRAFESDEVTPKTDLDPNQYWRTKTFNYYENGRWEDRPDGESRGQSTPRSSPPIDIADPSRPRAIIGNDAIARPAPNQPFAGRTRGNATLPNLGPQQVFLKFYPQSRGGQTPILAEPVWRASPQTPLDERKTSVVTVVRERQTAWFQTSDGEVVPPAFALVASPIMYRQVILPVGDSRRGARVRGSDAYREHYCNCRAVPELRKWTDQLVRSMEKAGTIPTAALGTAAETTEPIQVPPAHYETVVRALRNHLATSGEFEYTLNLQRYNERLDPVEDFVLNVKVGHCQRFATALVLMLRSVGIPSRIVLGYRGYDTDGTGVYEVRQNHAHAWVEALLPTPNEGAIVWQWHRFDPTPQSDDAVNRGSTLQEWYEWIRNSTSTFFRYFIIEYDADQQGRARNWFERVNWAATLVGPDGNQWWRVPVLIGVLMGAYAWIRRRRRAPDSGAANDPDWALFARMKAIVRRSQEIEPLVGQTPAEFAELAAVRLVDSSDPTLPSHTVSTYYRARFGRERISDSERANLSQRLDRLEANLGRST
jgi:hypothetical protein